MQIPIPDDWNHQAWHCVQISWPNSPLWNAILFGFLSQATRGRFWDGSTGSIKNAQATGWQIWDRNIPLIDCAGLLGPVLDGTTAILAGGCLGCPEDDDMPCVDLSGLLKIEDGVLYVKDSCGDWVAVGSFAPGAASEPIGDDPLNPDGDPGFTYSACGKATALIEKMRAVGQTAWDARTQPPWQYGKLFHADHPDLVGGTTWFTNAVLLAIQLDIVTSHEDVFDTNETDILKEWLADKLANDAAGLTSQQFDDLKTKIAQVNGGINLMDPTGIMKGNFWGAVMNAIGPGDAANITKMGAGNTAAVCEGSIVWPEIPVLYDWVHRYDFRPSLNGWTDGNTMWVVNQGFYNPSVNWAERLGEAHKTPVVTGGNMTFMAMRVTTWPTNPGYGGVGPWWFKVDADAYYSNVWIASQNWITWSPPTPPLIDGDISVANYQFDQTQPGEPSGVSKWYELLIAGTGADPFPADP